MRTRLRLGLIVDPEFVMLEKSVVATTLPLVRGLCRTFETRIIYDQATYDEVIADALAGDSWGVSGTPSFFINGRLLVGAQPYEVFVQIIDAELAAAGIQPPVDGAVPEADEGG